MLVYDLADPVELQGYVRNIEVPGFRLINEVLPGLLLDDLEYRFLKGDLAGMDIAQYRAFDTEAGIGTRGGVRRVTGELPPLSKKMPLGEEQRLRLRGLQRTGGDAARIADLIFDDAGRLTQSLLGRLEVAAGDSLVNGKVTISENGVAAEGIWGYTADNRKVAALSWLDPAAKIIDELQAWVEAYAKLSGGQRPAYFQTSLRYRNALLRNDQVRAFVGAPAGGPGLVTQDDLLRVFDAFDLPPLRTYDTEVLKAGVQTRVIPEHIGLLLPADGSAGRTYMGTTAEAIELVEARQIAADQLPGLTAVNQKTWDPVQTWTKVSGIGIPTIQQPQLVISARLNPALP